MLSYRVFGFAVTSNMELPELAKTSPSASFHADRPVLALERVLPHDNGSGGDGQWTVAIDGRTCMFEVPAVGRFLIEAGERLTVERFADVPSADMRAYLFGLAFPALAMQRGLIPLHISAVATPAGVWAFTGSPGAGKSSLAAQLSFDKNMRLVSDDVACIDPADPVPTLLSGINSVRLWSDAMQRFGLDPGRYDKYFGKDDKYQIDIPERFSRDTHALTNLVELSWADLDGIENVEGADKLRCLNGALFRPELLPFLWPGFLGLEVMAQVANRLRMHRLLRVKSPDITAQTAQIDAIVTYMSEGA